MYPHTVNENVRYARAGREAIIVLKEDGAVYWWGQLRTTSSTTVGGYDEYWSVTENPLNLVKMMYLEPHKVLDHCIYVDINAWNGAAITEDGELYLWGLNIFGQCGVSKSENVHDFVREPKRYWIRSVWYGWVESGTAMMPAPLMQISLLFDMDIIICLIGRWYVVGSGRQTWQGLCDHSDGGGSG